MNIAFWEVGLEVRLPSGRLAHVCSAADALSVLLNDWPKDSGHCHLDAKHACIDALSGVATSDRTMSLFVAAAREVGVTTQVIAAH
jgi:hypothetical protein